MRWYADLEMVDAEAVAVFFFALPVVGSALGVVFLGESVGGPFLVRGAVTGLGILLVSLRG